MTQKHDPRTRHFFFLRHPQTPHNVAFDRFRETGETDLLTEVKKVPSLRIRLTDEGHDQAVTLGKWLRTTLKSLAPAMTEFHCSPYERTILGAASLNLPNARWQVKRALSERNWGLVNNIDMDEYFRTFKEWDQIQDSDAWFWIPPHGGESLDAVADRIEPYIFDLYKIWRRYACIVAMSHADIGVAFQAACEHIWPGDIHDRGKHLIIPNGSVLWYQRSAKATNTETIFDSVELICPWDESLSRPRRRIEPSRGKTNAELRKMLGIS